MKRNLNSLEILSPAGDMESLKSAVSAGANAIYAGGSSFSARARAVNFSNEEIIDAIDYCHLRNVKLYIAVNTLIKDQEMKDVLEYASFLYENGVDALIVQDIGLIDLLRKNNIDMDLHFSTQSTITTDHDILRLKDLDISRIVLPREMNIKQIHKLKENTSLELEAFIHGSLCVCYSGKCLFSSLNGGRSGNRGSCAQICRKPYEMYIDGKKIIRDDKYLMSPKDLMTVEYLDEIIKSGVTSFKIEGRMKNKEYIYAVTKIYREILDEIIENGKASYENINIAKKNLRKVFNRDFTKGYILSSKGASIINTIFQKPIGEKIAKVIKYNKKEKRLYLKLYSDIVKGDGLSIGEKIGRIIKLDGRIVDFAKKGEKIKLDFVKNIEKNEIVYRTYDERFNIKINKGIANEKKRKIKAIVRAKKSENFTLQFISDEYKSDEIVSDEKVEIKRKRTLTKSDIIKHISKTGDTSFIVSDFDMDVEDDIFFPISIINSMRREASKSLEENIINSYRRKKIDIKTNFIKNITSSNNRKIKIFLKQNNPENIDETLKYLDKDDVLIVNDIETYKNLDFSRENTYLYLDILIDYKNFDSNYERAKKVDGRVITSSYSFSYLFENAIISPLMNAYNSFTHNYYNKRNMTMISYESSFEEKDEYYYIDDKEKVILPVYSYPEYMITEFCPHKDELGKCKYNYNCHLPMTVFENKERDRFHFKRFSNCKVIIYSENAHKIDKDYYKKMLSQGFTNIFIELNDENPKEILNWR